MTRRDEIIRMAHEAGFTAPFRVENQPFRDGRLYRRLERFAALVAIAERERCALIAVSARDGYSERSNLMAGAADYIACAIRALKDEVSE